MLSPNLRKRFQQGWNMARIRIEQLIREIDVDLAVYAPFFIDKSFTSNRTMKCWRDADFDTFGIEVPEEHRD